MNKTSLSQRRRRQGFSLLEMLSVIAVIGIICGIAIVNGIPDDRYAAARDQRNAQELAALCESASAAGLNFVVADNMDETLANIIRGGTPEKGVFKGRIFSLRSMSAASAKSASKYLRLVGNGLLYQPALPSAPSTVSSKLHPSIPCLC
jgi:prepilin-type N-terminal cleavage/methylation domain-containing protein